MRVNALLRRGRGIHSAKISFADITLDRDTCTLTCREASCVLSHREMQLMEFLMRTPRVYFSADALLDHVWGLDAEVEQGTVWAHVSYLRKKLEALNARAAIVSRRGIGYALEVRS